MRIRGSDNPNLPKRRKNQLKQGERKCRKGKPTLKGEIVMSREKGKVFIKIGRAHV